jgi:hypothetical protein
VCLRIRPDWNMNRIRGCSASPPNAVVVFSLCAIQAIAEKPGKGCPGPERAGCLTLHTPLL